MSLRVTLAVALRGRQEVIALEMPEGSRVADVLAAAKAGEFFPGIALADLRVGIWAKACAMDTALRDGDRVEIYRPLQADAKDMRRARARLKPSSRSRSGP
jgi:putative ubiquitin-RnfH superfamily antitoxin RatB of RatAB toxin-antitoxin module